MHCPSAPHTSCWRHALLPTLLHHPGAPRRRKDAVEDVDAPGHHPPSPHESRIAFALAINVVSVIPMVRTRAGRCPAPWGRTRGRRGAGRRRRSSAGWEVGLVKEERRGGREEERQGREGRESKMGREKEEREGRRRGDGDDREGAKEGEEARGRVGCREEVRAEGEKEGRDDERKKRGSEGKAWEGTMSKDGRKGHAREGGGRKRKPDEVKWTKVKTKTKSTSPRK
ncbi:hypothetical protein B0H13DRAFT_1865715 [Mycena leptocephala]|nr:hypothetical protein B0H13DRAFT_1865715 [Mycena leptocephala]